MANEWEFVKLGDLAAVRSGYAFKSKDWTDYGIPVVKIANVKDGRLEMGGCSYVSSEVAAAASEFNLNTGDILIAMTGYIGDIARVKANDLPCVLNQRVGLFSIKHQTRLHDGYLFYFLRSTETRKTIEGLGYGSAQPNVSPSLIHNVEVPLPPLKEQQAIACILGALDDKIELNRRMNRTLEATARAIFKSWFVDFDPVLDNALVSERPIPESMRERVARRLEAIASRSQRPGSLNRPLPAPIADLFPDAFEESELDVIPKGWRVGKVGDLAEINGWTLSKRDHLDEIDYIEISEVMRGEIANITRYARGCEPGRARRRLRHGDTAISTVRPDRRSYFLSIEPSPNLIASTGFAVLTAKAERWAFVHVLTTRDEFGLDLGRLADGGAYPAVRPEVIGARPAVVPAEEQVMSAFEDVAQPMLLRADAARKESHTLAAVRDALLPKLISGELQVPDAERIVGRCV